MANLSLPFLAPGVACCFAACPALLRQANTTKMSPATSSTVVLAAHSAPSAAKAKPAAAAPAAPKSPRGAGLKKPVDISPALQQFLGAPQASRADTMKLVWDYIKSHDLQVCSDMAAHIVSANDRRLIVCDEKLKDLLGKDEVNFLELAKLLSPHFVKST